MSSRVTQRKVNRSEASVPQKGQIREESEVGPDQPPIVWSDSFSKTYPEDAPPTGLSSTLKWTILGMICLVSFAIRLFAVFRWESVIHEFDPYFNYRTTKFLGDEGFYSFLNWQDDRSWYPLGRLVGGTVYPGLMITSELIRNALTMLNFTINVRNMCVFLAPLFASLTALATYLLTSEVYGRTGAGLIAAAMIGIAPSYISRSVAGSYDNEGVAIFALVFTFYLWIKAVKTGRLAWAAATAIGYFYMVAAWGGYVFIINIIPIYVVVMLFSGRYSGRLYVAYSTFYILGSLLAMQVPFVGFNVVKQAESAASHGVFLMLQAWAIYTNLSRGMTPAAFASLKKFVLLLAGSVTATAAVVLIGLQLSGRMQWTGRSLTLLDPTYAKKYIPIIASVSEHQPTPWTSFFFDLHAAVPLAPVGLYFLFQDWGVPNENSAVKGDGKIFLILYGTISWYFAGVMVRLMLTLAPIACILAAIGVSGTLYTFSGHLKSVLTQKKTEPQNEESETQSTSYFSPVVSVAIGASMFAMLCLYALHGTYVSSEAYSSPSIVLASRRQDGSRVIFDDFREAYYWMRMNTAEDAKILAWWDYGYQMTSMANRTVLVDNNTWNNTHIATVGRALASNEQEAYPILLSLDVDYVLLTFGGLSGYQSDDINKFLWMVRIAGGVFPQVKESAFYADGQYRMDKGGSQTMFDSLMYKLSYYRFEDLPGYGRQGGYDVARNVLIGYKGYELEHFEEAFTSEHWLVRIYKVKKPVVTDGELFENEDNSKSNFGRSNAAMAATNTGRLSYDKKKRYVPQEHSVSIVGCYTDENMFGEDRVYAGGPAGAYFSVARDAAIAAGKKYFAIARVGHEGHSFSMNGPLPPPDSNSPACGRPCVDDAMYACGCSDAACEIAPTSPMENIRRWVVYRLD